MIDWKISAGTVLGILLSVLLAHLLTKRREQEKAYLQEVTSFKESFVVFLKALEEPNANPNTIVTQHFHEQDELARKLLLKIPKTKNKKFTAKWLAYKKLYLEKKSLGFAALIATEVDDISKANPATSEGIEYMLKQTDIRRQEIIKVVNEALETLS